jgi:hypothetical protein
MINFRQYLTEAQKEYKKGIVSHLDIMSHWANELHKMQDPSHTTQSHTPNALKWFSRTNKPFTVPDASNGWIVQTDNPSSKTAKADIMVHAPEGHKSFGIEAKSGRPSLTSATLGSSFDINPQSPVAKHIYNSLMSGRLKKMAGWMQKKQQTQTDTSSPTRRFLKMKKIKGEQYHPVVSEYENALHKSGIKAISITDGKGNIRHFSTNPEHEERLSKYVDVAHIQHKQGRLSLRVGQVTSGGQTRKETQGISFLSKQPIGYSVKQIVDLNS